MSQQDNNRATGRLAIKLVVVVVAMFGFGFALVPLYDVFCEITGLNGKTDQLAASDAATLEIDRDRLVTVQFDGNVNSGLPWEFGPEEFSMKVHPGEVATTQYWAENLSSKAIVGQAVPSVAPAEASKYFAKTECFCFTEQLLAAGERKLMPVQFVVASDLPQDIKVMTLSYRFFINEQATAAVAAAEGVTLTQYSGEGQANGAGGR